jgi:hypothetical protein
MCDTNNDSMYAMDVLVCGLMLPTRNNFEVTSG